MRKLKTCALISHGNQQNYIKALTTKTQPRHWRGRMSFAISGEGRVSQELLGSALRCVI